MLLTCSRYPRPRRALDRNRGSLWQRAWAGLETPPWPAQDYLAEQLSRDLDGMGLWEAWYLAMDWEKWREFATSLCCSGVR